MKLKRKKELTWKQKVRNDVVEDIKKFLTQYENQNITATVAILVADEVVNICDRIIEKHEIHESEKQWVYTYVNLLMWGFSGAIVITPDSEME